jgi:hypothetical protein
MLALLGEQLLGRCVTISVARNFMSLPIIRSFAAAASFMTRSPIDMVESCCGGGLMRSRSRSRMMIGSRRGSSRRGSSRRGSSCCGGDLLISRSRRRSRREGDLLISRSRRGSSRRGSSRREGDLLISCSSGRDDLIVSRSRCSSSRSRSNLLLISRSRSRSRRGGDMLISRSRSRGDLMVSTSIQSLEDVVARLPCILLDAEDFAIRTCFLRLLLDCTDFASS